VLEAEQRGVTAPNLARIAHEGAYATGVRGALPTVTYPNHTTLVTGVWPAKHGIVSNVIFDPLRKEVEGWYWYAPEIKVPTLWDVVHAAHKRVASLGWPVTVDAPSIDDNIPEYWRAHTAEDAKLDHALATRGLPEAIEAKAHVTLADMAETEPANDEAKAKAAAAIIALRKPEFFTLHLSSVDHIQHLHAPGSPEAHEAIRRVDAAVGELIAAARKVQPDLVVTIVSDHGFTPIEHDINIVSAFVDAGLITLNDAGKVASWDAAPWISGGSAAVVLAHPDDASLRAKVADVLNRLASDPASGVGQVADKAEIAAMGGNPEADFFLDAKLGYEFGGNLKAASLVTASTNKGTHGYFPTHPEMRATFMLDGPKLAKHGSLGDIDMRDIAPTVAKILGVKLTSAEGRPLF
jgi:predicted AlkP superfamily pyrophosphatase or phosphodiesterase